MAVKTMKSGNFTIVRKANGNFYGKHRSKKTNLFTFAYTITVSETINWIRHTADSEEEAEKCISRFKTRFAEDFEKIRKFQQENKIN